MNRCANCGADSDDPLERCPACGAFATLLPFTPPPAPAPPAAVALSVDAGDVTRARARPLSTGSEAWDKALCGGMVLGSTVVLYGQPGARKSTWAGAIADAIACSKPGARALFLSAEMPAWQVREAVERIRAPRNLSIIGNETDAAALDRCLAEVLRLRPRVVVYDSIQAFEVGGQVAGSDAAISAAVRLAKKYAAQLGHLAILVSQVNKAGQPAGPYRTIHDCDVVIELAQKQVHVHKHRGAAAPKTAELPPLRGLRLV